MHNTVYVRLTWGLRRFTVGPKPPRLPFVSLCGLLPPPLRPQSREDLRLRREALVRRPVGGALGVRVWAAACSRGGSAERALPQPAVSAATRHSAAALPRGPLRARALARLGALVSVVEVSRPARSLSTASG